MEAIILVGGLGTRLGKLTDNTPKPMLPIRNKPFLHGLLDKLFHAGIRKVTLATGYHHEVIADYFNHHDFQNLPEITFSRETTPLGTGGGILKALSNLSSNEVFVINGDSYLELDYKKMLIHFKQSNSDLTIATRHLENACRYGVIQVDQTGLVRAFNEKGHKEGLINGGVYLFRVEKVRQLLSALKESSFSFEEDFLSSHIEKLKVSHFQTEGKFIDIGIPEDYNRAQEELFLE